MSDYGLPVAAIVGGLLLLVKGGDGLVKHAAHLAASYRVPKIVVGAVIIGFGTSLPELVVSVLAAVEKSPAIAIGNVVGSNIANTALIFGLGAALAGLHVGSRVLRMDLPLAVLAALFLLFIPGRTGEVSRLEGVVLLAGFALYIGSTLGFALRNRVDVGVELVVARSPAADLAWISLGLLAVVGGAHLLVNGAVDIARLAGVSELTIGLSVVAVGTSLPELAALLAAMRRGEGDLAVGNIFGSNVFNMGLVLGTTAVIRPVPVEPVMVDLDLPVLAALCLLAYPIFSRERRVGRLHGALLLGCYALYWTWRARN